MTGRTAWIERFADLAALAPDDRALLLERVSIGTFPGGSVVFSPGAPSAAWLLVLDGSVRVQMLADTGREIVLYRVRGGETCVLTTACMIGDEVYAATGIVEETTTAAAVPRPVFDTLVARSDHFRRFVFAGFGRRVAEILETMQAAVFHRIDARLARHLLGRGETSVAVTHRDLAVELGTAREVVSRNLAVFERRGWVRLGRGSVEIVDRTGLARLAEADE